MKQFCYYQRYALTVLLWLSANISFATGEPISMADKSAIVRVIRNYADLYTCIVMQTEITKADLDNVFIEGSVQLPNDYMPARDFFQTRDQYFRTASNFFGNNRLISNCNIRLTESEEYLYARLSDGTYYIWLDKSIDYLDARNVPQHYSFCEQIHVRLVADHGYRIMGVVRVREKPADNDGDGIADSYEQGLTREEQAILNATRTSPGNSTHPDAPSVTPPSEQLSNQPTMGSVNRVWVKAHWRKTYEGWVWIDGYWRNDSTQSRTSYSPPQPSRQSSAQPSGQTSSRSAYAPPVSNYYIYPQVQSSQSGQVVYRPRSYFTWHPLSSIFGSRRGRL